MTTDLIIPHDGDTWRILGQGATRDGKVYCHLASTTQGRQQRNGWNPAQIGVWIDPDVILSAEDEAIESFNIDMSNSCDDGDRKFATGLLAKRLGDVERAERLRRDWMTQERQAAREV